MGFRSSPRCSPGSSLSNGRKNRPMSESTPWRALLGLKLGFGCWGVGAGDQRKFFGFLGALVGR